MLIGEALRTTLAEVWAHKLRSSLTLFGVVLGTMAVVTMVSLIEAVKVEVWRGVEMLGFNEVMFVSAAEPRTPYDRKRSHLSAGLRSEDAEALVAGTDLIEAAAPVAFSQRWVRIGDHRFEVVGIGAELGNAFVQDGFSNMEMQGATIPLATLQGLFSLDQRVPLMIVRVAGTEGLAGKFALLKNRLWRQHRRVEDFEVDNVAAEIVEAEQQIDENLRGWTIVLFAISAISLVVGGIGIFSVLQISLAERLFEIGLRKSIGARDRDILLQFLVEAVFLSIMGAVIGFAISVGVCTALGPKFDAGLPISSFAVVLAVVFAVGVGLAAGIYPSLRAARMTPVEALQG